jgi:hypothetical protein
MRSIDGRLNKLEYRLGIARNAPRYLLIVMDAGREFGPADEAYIRSLSEAGLLPTSGFAMIDLGLLPDRSVPNRSAVKHNMCVAPEITVELV